jgi:hypothetical protein
MLMETENKDIQGMEETKVDETTEKTYTHIDVDNSFKAGYKKAKTELEKSEDYKKYKEWEKSNQNDSEKINELQLSLDKLTKENQLLKATNEVAKSDVKPEFLKFVTSEVMNMVNDTTDFETALKDYKQKNSQFFGEVVVKKVQSSPILNGGTQSSTVDDIFNNMIRNA